MRGLILVRQMIMLVKTMPVLSVAQEAAALNTDFRAKPLQGPRHAVWKSYQWIEVQTDDGAGAVFPTERPCANSLHLLRVLSWFQ